jgi:hypothetical protein
MIMAMHLTAPVPDPRDSNPLIEVEISLIIQQMMAKEPADRFQTMEEVDEALARHQLKMSDLPQSAVALEKPERIDLDSTPTQPLSQPAGQSGKGLWLAVAAGVAVLAAGVFGYFSMNKTPPPKSAAAAPSAAAPAPKPAPPAKPAAPATPAPPADTGSLLLLADFDRAADPQRLDSWVSAAPSEARCFAGVQAGKGVNKSAAWGIGYDISAKDSSARATLKLDNVDATAYKTLTFKTRVDGISALTYALDVKVGPAQRRYKIKNVGRDWTTVKIPLAALSLPALKPMNELTVVVEWGTSNEKKGTILIDDIALSKD